MSSLGLTLTSRGRQHGDNWALGSSILTLHAASAAGPAGGGARSKGGGDFAGRRHRRQANPEDEKVEASAAPGGRAEIRIRGAAHHFASSRLLYLNGYSGAKLAERARQLRGSGEIVSSIVADAQAIRG
jgi:hypothetical protein